MSFSGSRFHIRAKGSTVTRTLNIITKNSNKFERLMRAITTQFLERNNDMLYLQKKFFNYMMLSFSERFDLSSSHFQRVI